ncbi:P-loop containing nucleoside triphosphate hydrolase protein [Hygrophoropsis aurantiaca]|uniref:P-loop containing nucleoside triphosphate hydrolase protein n=1 Tax=Hygrophoropsis aurantiaca TaxID=72124 RepID=A0ACB8ADH6_9AGAM|nr:P-loop containing nucleoside triphosphate hydrolase protein [Hygrophoropsis aurantiaca]
MRLQTLVPMLPLEVVSALDTIGIKTDSDLLFPGSVVDIVSKLPHGTTSLADLKKYIALVAEKSSAVGMRADEVLDREVAMRSAGQGLVSGIVALDKLVDGFGGSRVFEISGIGGSGKTSLASHVVLRHLANFPNAYALWIDTAGAFSPEKTAQLSRLYSGDGAAAALERLQVSLIFNIETAYDVLEELTASLSSDPERKFSCVVIDTVTSLLAGTLSAVTSEGHAAMTTFMHHLRSLAQTYFLTFIIINNTSSASPHNPHSAFASTDRKPALGPSFTFLSDCTIWLAKKGESRADDESGPESLHVAEVFRSKHTRSKTWCTFKIHQGILCAA